MGRVGHGYPLCSWLGLPGPAPLGGPPAVSGPGSFGGASRSEPPAPPAPPRRSRCCCTSCSWRPSPPRTAGGRASSSPPKSRGPRPAPREQGRGPSSRRAGAEPPGGAAAPPPAARAAARDSAPWRERPGRAPPVVGPGGAGRAERFSRNGRLRVSGAKGAGRSGLAGSRVVVLNKRRRRFTPGGRAPRVRAGACRFPRSERPAPVL